MSQTTDDVLSGLVCMTCLRFLFNEAGTEVCSAGHPVYCEDCWKELPRKARQSGAPYWDEKTGTVLNVDTSRKVIQ